MSLLRVVPILAFLAISFPSLSYSQVLYGSLVGNVADPTNASVPGAAVRLKSQETGSRRSTTESNTQGPFSSATCNPDLTMSSFRHRASRHSAGQEW